LLLLIACVLTPIYFVVDAQQQEAASADTKDKQTADNQSSLEEERLKILKGDIKKEIERYDALKLEVEKALKELDIKKTESLQRLAKIFEAMQAEDAARRIEKLDKESAVAILSTLKPKSAGKILSQVDPSLAAELSEKILIRGKVK